MDFKILPFELKSAAADGSTFDGFANAFCNIDAAQEAVQPGSFKDTLPQFMQDGFIGGLNHNWDSPIGSPTQAEEQAMGLFVGGKISPTTHGKDCMILLKDRVVKKLSIGYRVLRFMDLEDGDAVAAWWKDMGYTPSAADIAASAMGCRVLTKVHLFEFSPVTVPANDLADITRVKRYMAGDLPNKRAFETFLRDSGLSRKEAVEMIAMLFKGLQREADEATVPVPQDCGTQEPQVPDEPPITEPEQEAKTEGEPTEAPPLAVAPVVEKADSRQAAALYANFLTIQARLLGTNATGKRA